MIKYIFIILLCFSGNAYAADIINETNIYTTGDLETVGGSHYIVPHMHYWDSWFALYNDGGVSYHIYLYDYNGSHPNTYLDAYIGTIAPNEMITLNSNASYRIYATSPLLSGVTVEKIEKRFNQYWFVGILIIIILVVGIKIWREIKK